MPLGDGTGPRGRGPGSGRRIGRCFRGQGAGRRIGGTGLGATLLTWMLQDCNRENSMIRSGLSKVLGRFTSRKPALASPEKIDRNRVVDVEYQEITDNKGGTENAKR
ncbi:DUF5320 family protein [candidate division KSB1 bacterium]